MNKNILVTGGTGFIGGHLVKRLLDDGYHVIVPYITFEKDSFFVQSNLKNRVTLEKVDIRNKEKVFQLIQTYKPEYIFHLAAQTLVTEGYKDPLTTLETNIMGTAYLLEAMRVIGRVKGIIVASTDKAYGKTHEAYTEEAPLKGDHPYDVSKSSADLITQTYYKTYNTPVIVTRFGNVYGEGDLHLDRIIPGICEAIIKKKTLEIRSDGTYVRDYLYIKDVVNGYIFLLHHFNDLKGEAFNFSSTDTYSVLQLIEKAEKILDKKISYKILNIAKNEIPYQHLDDTKIKKMGWEPKHTLENCLENTFQWYKKHIF